MLPVYTIAEAAKALGKTRITLRKWIENGIMPPPAWKDTSRGYDHYLEQELKLIAKVLIKHEAQFDYLHNTHEDTIGQLWQVIEDFRK